MINRQRKLLFSWQINDQRTQKTVRRTGTVDRLSIGMKKLRKVTFCRGIPLLLSAKRYKSLLLPAESYRYEWLFFSTKKLLVQKIMCSFEKVKNHYFLNANIIICDLFVRCSDSKPIGSGSASPQHCTLQYCSSSLERISVANPVQYFKV